MERISRDAHRSFAPHHRRCDRAPQCREHGCHAFAAGRATRRAVPHGAPVLLRAWHRLRADERTPLRDCDRGCLADCPVALHNNERRRGRHADGARPPPQPPRAPVDAQGGAAVTTLLPPPTASEETQETVIVEDDTRTFLGGTTTTVMVDAAGVRRFATTTQRVRASDGRLVDPTEPLYSCKRGKTLLTSQSVTFCTTCRMPVCFGCVRRKQAVELCRPCNG